MIKNLDTVKTTLRIAGKRCLFVHLSLTQSFNSHQHFKIVLNYESLGGGWMSDPRSILTLIGEEVLIEFKHSIKGSFYLFDGLITDVSIVGRNGVSNNILITGKSPSIRLDGPKTMNSFVDRTLTTIAKNVVSDSSHDMNIQIAPQHNDIIDYVCQHHESNFEFLNRLSWLYGEWFYYTGTALKFGQGKPSSEGEVNLIYDVNMIDINLSASLVPAKFARYHYLKHEHTELEAWSTHDVPGLRGYQEAALQKSDSLYAKEGTLPIGASVSTKKELDELMKVERSRAVSRMLTVQGTSKTSEIQIGKVVNVKMPSNVDLSQVDSFLITSIEHTVDELDRYSNSFTGIISEGLAIPMEAIEAPIANPQQAVVVENDDAKGRVRVQFQWQQEGNRTTNWIRVQTPDAGKSDRVGQNRGFVFIPEVGDQVMVGFEYGDPHRPYVMGSLFNVENGKGGGSDNNVKSIITRSGHTIELNDNESGDWGITIKDMQGNLIQLNTAGKSITISSIEEINLLSKNINVEAAENIKITAGKNYDSTIGGEYSNEVTGNYRESITGKKTEAIEGKLKTDIEKNAKIRINKDFEMEVGAETDIKGIGKSYIHSEDSMNLTSSTKVNVAKK